MKKLFISIISVAILFTGHFRQVPAQTAGEILKKAVAFHDPENKWADFSGKVYLTTTFSDGRNSGGEIIEFRNGEGFYQCTKLSANTIFGVRNGQPFREIDGNRNPDKQAIEKTGMGDEVVSQYNQWHSFHFNILEELMASGLLLSDKVETVKFHGNDCLALRFDYDSLLIKDRFYEGSDWTLFIDPSDYSLKGYREDGLMNFHSSFTGILNVNGLILPLCRIYFMNEDNSFYMADVFSNPIQSVDVKSDSEVAEELDQLWQDYIDSSNAGDLDKVMTFFTDDYINMPAIGSTQSGKQETREFLSVFLDNSKPKINWYKQSEAFIHGTMAYAFGNFEMVLSEGGSTGEPYLQRCITVYKKDREGNWKLHRWMGQD